MTVSNYIFISDIDQYFLWLFFGIEDTVDEIFGDEDFEGPDDLDIDPKTVSLS